MKHDAMKLTSSYNNQLYIKVMNGHFATNHSHINQYIDMTTLKVRGTMAGRCQIHGNRICSINYR